MGALRDLAARLRAREAAAPEPVAVPEPVEVPAPPPPEAALARLEAAEPVAAAPAPPEPPPSPALPWHAMAYGAERGRAFAEAKAARAACAICAGRRWWRRAGTDEAPTCATCHPPDHLAPEAVQVFRT